MLKSYSIATGNLQSTNAAAEILDSGGNAYDAILAALFMSFVCEPLLSSPGGGGYLLAHAKNSKPQIYDFFAQTPHNKSINEKDFYPIIGDFGTTQQEFHIGLASAAIPGIPAGIFAIHNHLGTMPLTEIAWQAIEQAKKGVIIDKLQAEVIQILKPILNASCTVKQIFTNNKHKFLTEGETKKNKDLAQFMDNLSSNSMDWFYYDSPAESICHDMKHYHGLLTLTDFHDYQVKIRTPLIHHIKGWKIITNSEPTTGGFLITEQLKHANNNIGTNRLHRILEAMKHADKLKNSTSFQCSKGTTHMSIIDSENNVASLTVSNGEGCGYVVPHSGFMLNNFLGEEDINSTGFFNFKENTRMASMMSPTVIENKLNRIALGTGGSNRIKTSLFQVIWNIINDNMTLSQSINQARLHYENNTLEIEDGVVLDELEDCLIKCEHINHWNHRSLFFGGINAVSHGDINLAIGDSRRNGVGLTKLFI